MKISSSWVAITLAVFSQIANSFSKIVCENTSFCRCYKSGVDEYEFQCPPNDYSDDETEGMVIHIGNNKIQIDCYKLETLDPQLIVPINASDLNNIEIRFCPLPPSGKFKDVIDRFGLERTTGFTFERTRTRNLTLSKENFEGLDTLQNLELTRNDLYLDKNVFENTPNLTYLDLEHNNSNFTKGLFSHTPLIQVLHAPGNEMTEISDGVFDDLKNLRILQLWRNELVIIEDFYFRGLTKLNTLELSFNKIKNISSNAFKDLIELKSLSLKFNKIGDIPYDLFKHTKNLELIYMNSNPNLELSDYLFADLPNLKSVSLSSCNISEIPDHIFNNSTTLLSLDVENNRITDLNDEFLKDATQLENLKMKRNKFQKIPLFIRNLKALKTLELDHNSIEILKQGDFVGLVNLETLSLGNNRIASIELSVFATNGNIKVINLANNLYDFDRGLPEYIPSQSSISPFNNCIKLERLDLSDNTITSFDWYRFISNIEMMELDLQRNRIEHIDFNDLHTNTRRRIKIRLDSNNISTVDFSQAEWIAQAQTYESTQAMSYSDDIGAEVYITNNPINCDCAMIDLARYIRDELDPRVRSIVDLKIDEVKCQEPKELLNVPIKEIPKLALTCNVDKMMLDRFKNTRNSSDQCTSIWRPEDRGIIVDCSDRQLEEIPVVNLTNIGIDYNHTEIHLENNLLMNGPNVDRFIARNITELYLSNNNISELDWIPSNLSVLRIDNNRLSSIDYNILNTLNSSLRLSKVSLHDNPWECNCAAANFTEFLRDQSKTLDNNRLITCRDSDQILTDLNRTELCQDLKIIYIVVPILLIFLFTTIVVALYFRFELETKIWLYSKNLCLWWVTEDELDKDKTYDVFISYSHKDEDFVIENLLPVLENGPQPYKLCLHQRHFLPGAPIAEQICNSVAESRRTLVVLSPSFLKSVWGKMEFRVAHTQAISDGRARVIVVLLGEIDIDSVDDELKAYLKTNTYVQWGDPWFWSKLKYALPHSKCLPKNIQKHANIINAIDDQFKLVSEEDKRNTGSRLGTTPPIITLDSGLLEKHPLNFLPMKKIDANAPSTLPAEAGLMISVQS